MVGNSSTKDAFGEIKELDAANDEKKVSGSRSLKITEIEFLRRSATLGDACQNKNMK
jgi:hypothetical protein